MRTIGISLLTLFALATSACGESPTASAAGADASMNGGFVGSGHYEEEGPGTSGTGGEAKDAEEETMTTMEGNPGLAGSGH
ncbi:MAG TPA: hypothetical protein VK358_01345 [Longimicrobium sp.]|nr:hypothetical protein [Longimicrobium sp.]